MALAAFFVATVTSVDHTNEFATVGVGQFELGVTSQAELTGRVQGQEFHFVRVINARAMTVLTLDVDMTGRIELADISSVTLDANLTALVFHRECFPLVDIAESVIAVGEISTVDAKVVRHEEDSCNQY
jgi:hypothetical protein